MSPEAVAQPTTPEPATPKPAVLVLASASPRRQQMLADLGVAFELCCADIDERVAPGERADDYVMRMACEKAAFCAALIASGRPVLAADTSVVIDKDILGKPQDHDDAMAMLSRLSGREHRVLTAVCLLVAGSAKTLLCETKVKFVTLSREDTEAYLATDEPWDKAGAYAIQGLAGVFVESINGSYSSVVGLPLAETRKLLRAAGINGALEGGYG